MAIARCTTILPPPMPGTDSYAYFAMFTAPPPPRDPVFAEELQSYEYEMDSVMPSACETEPVSGELPTTPCLDIAV